MGNGGMGLMEKDNQQMDLVDQAQQKEIEDLKKKDIAHDKDLFWLSNWFRYGARFVLTSYVIWVICSSTIILVLLDKIDKLTAMLIK